MTKTESSVLAGRNWIADATMLLALVSLVVVGRLAFLQWPNFTTLSAASLFAGHYFGSARGRVSSLAAMLVPTCGVLLSNIWLTPHASRWVAASVLLCGMFTTFVPALTCGRSSLALNKRSIPGIAIGCVLPSMVFFFVTNFAVWVAQPGQYEQNLSGLAACYAAAIPFYRNMLAADLLFSPALFAAWYLATAPQHSRTQAKPA